jgi:hypothetical protein
MSTDFSDPSLRPLSAGQVADPIGVTLQAKATEPAHEGESPDSKPEVCPTCAALLAAGFKLRAGAWSRGRR